MFINVSGDFRKGVPWVNVGGTWRKGVASWVNVNGDWRKMAISVIGDFINITDDVGLHSNYNEQIRDICSDPTGTKILIVGDVGTYAYSSNAGEDWFVDVFASQNWESCGWDPTTSQFYVGEHQGRINVSSDPTAGFTFYDTFGSGPIVGIEAFQDSQGKDRLLLLASDGNLKDLKDASATWPKGLNSGASSNANCLAQDGDLVFVGFQSGYAALSTDGGASFNGLPRGLGVYARPNITDAAIYGDTIIVGMADQYASISTDRGQTWKPIPRGFGNPSRSTVRGTSVVASENGLVALMHNGQAFTSGLTGENWEELDRGLGVDVPNIDSAVLSKCGDALYAGFNVGITGGYVSKGVLNG